MLPRHTLDLHDADGRLWEWSLTTVDSNNNLVEWGLQEVKDGMTTGPVYVLLQQIERRSR